MGRDDRQCVDRTLGLGDCNCGGHVGPPGR